MSGRVLVFPSQRDPQRGLSSGRQSLRREPLSPVSFRPLDMQSGGGTETVRRRTRFESGMFLAFSVIVVCVMAAAMLKLYRHMVDLPDPKPVPVTIISTPS